MTKVLLFGGKSRCLTSQIIAVCILVWFLRFYGGNSVGKLSSLKELWNFVSGLGEEVLHQRASLCSYWFFERTVFFQRLQASFSKGQKGTRGASVFPDVCLLSPRDFLSIELLEWWSLTLQSSIWNTYQEPLFHYWMFLRNKERACLSCHCVYKQNYFLVL